MINHCTSIHEITELLCTAKEEAKRSYFSNKYTTEPIEIFYSKTATTYSIDADIDERGEEFKGEAFAVDNEGRTDNALSNELTEALQNTYNSFYATKQEKEIRADRIF